MANKNMRSVKIYGMSGYKYQATPSYLQMSKKMVLAKNT